MFDDGELQQNLSLRVKMPTQFLTNCGILRTEIHNKRRSRSHDSIVRHLGLEQTRFNNDISPIPLIDMLFDVILIFQPVSEWECWTQPGNHAGGDVDRIHILVLRTRSPFTMIEGPCLTLYITLSIAARAVGSIRSHLKVSLHLVMQKECCENFKKRFPAFTRELVSVLSS